MTATCRVVLAARRMRGQWGADADTTTHHCDTGTLTHTHSCSHPRPNRSTHAHATTSTTCTGLHPQIIVVTIDFWEAAHRFPTGHYVRTIGNVGDTEAESEAILMEHEVKTSPFSAQVQACLPEKGWRITDEEIAKRVDLRDKVPQRRGAGTSPTSQRPAAVVVVSDVAGSSPPRLPPLPPTSSPFLAFCPQLLPFAASLTSHPSPSQPGVIVCSVDPPGCVDIDDALHARLLPPEEGGNPPGEPQLFECGVHIADVGHFIKVRLPPTSTP